MKRTRVSLLLAVAVIVTGATYAVVAQIYERLPALTFAGPALIVFLAAVEGIAAGAMRSRLRGRPQDRPPPMLVARLVALAKASSLSGAVAAGVYGGLLTYTVQNLQARTPEHDTVVSSSGVVASLMLVVFALWLEYVGRLPDGYGREPQEPRREWDPLRDWHNDR